MAVGWFFPRHAAQAVALDAQHDVDLVLDLDIPEAEILSRLGGRRVHVASGRSYHIEWNPPKQEGIDDETGRTSGRKARRHGGGHQKTTAAAPRPREAAHRPLWCEGRDLCRDGERRHARDEKP